MKHVDRDGRCVVFVHIPKAAGTTIATTLQMNYPPDRTLHINLHGELERLATIPAERLAAVRLIHGHVPYGVHRYVPRPCDYVTVLREPTARVISAYKFIRRWKPHELHDRVVRDRIGLEQFIETFCVDRRISRQTRQLIDQYDGPLTTGALDDAKSTLERFLVAGLTERFEETLALMRRALRLRVPFYVTRNVGFPLDISDRAIEMIREREALDLELYAFAQDLFERRVRAQGKTFGAETALYKAMRPLSRSLARGRARDVLRTVSHARTARSQRRSGRVTPTRSND
jgi:hypothetical protein